MKKGRFTEAQIFSILKEFDAGKNIQELSREYGVSKATIYNWKAKYGGMDASQLKQIKDLQEENSRLKRMFSELSMVHDALKQVVEKKWGA